MNITRPLQKWVTPDVVSPGSGITQAGKRAGTDGGSEASHKGVSGMSFTRKSMYMAALGTAFCAVFASTIQPVNSVSNVVLNGQAGTALALFAGAPNATPLTSAPGISDGTFTPVAADTADGFTDTVNFGTLSNGDGTNSVARVAFRERGNAPCHVSCSVSAYTANNIAYNGTPLTGSAVNAAQLSFVSLGNIGMTAGGQGNSTGATYGARFTSGADTLATLNGGVIAAVATGKDQFVNLPNAPSRTGNLNSATNYVENTATFSVPTGFVWATNGAAPNNWSTTIQFMIYPNP
jgi:hypothetical protein